MEVILPTNDVNIFCLIQVKSKLSFGSVILQICTWSQQCCDQFLTFYSYFEIFLGMHAREKKKKNQDTSAQEYRIGDVLKDSKAQEGLWTVGTNILE